MIKFGMISFAHMHANSYASTINNIFENDGSAKLVAVADDNEDRGRAACAEFRAGKFFNDYKEMLSGDSVDAVIISSENAKHLEHTVAAAKAGKHIICEKPLSISQSSLTEMQSALQQANKRIFFQTAFPMRYDPAVVEAKRTLESGTLGAVKGISATNHGKYPGGWFVDKELSGGGAIMDHTVHVADLIRYFTADEFDSVRAFTGINIHDSISVEDNALIYTKLKHSQAPVSIDCSWSRADEWPIWGDVVVELVCEKGVLKIDCFKPHLELLSHGKFAWHSMVEDLNQKMIRAFCRAIESGEEPKASFDDGAKAALLAIAAYRSLEKNDTVSV